MFLELSPHNNFFSKMVARPGHTLESAKNIEMKLGLQIDGSERKCNAQ